jgi:DNA-binding NtrC family response regulator
MTSVAVTHTLATPQIMAANFLNLPIVDDERSIRDACREVALSLGFIAHVADSAEHAYRLLQVQSIDAVLLDLRLPGAGGLEALRQIKAHRPEALVIVVTGYGTVQSAVQAMKHGAYEYVTKPFSVEELKLLLQRVSNHLKLKTENRMLREKLKSKQGYGGIVGRAPRDGEALPHHRQSRQQFPPCADPWRERHGQRNGRALHPLLRTFS